VSELSAADATSEASDETRRRRHLTAVPDLTPPAAPQPSAGDTDIERSNGEEQQRTTRRRDKNPIKVTADGEGFRVSWWPSGTPGVGAARPSRKRFSTQDAAATFVAKLEASFRDAADGAEVSTTEPLDALAAAWIADLRELCTPEGTVVTHRTRLNTSILPAVGGVVGFDLAYSHWKKVVRAAAARGAANATIKGISSTFVVACAWGAENGWLAADHSLGTAERRSRELEKAYKTAARVRASRPAPVGRRRKRPVDVIDDEGVVPYAVIPRWPDIDELAYALDAEYPQRGRHLVRVTAGSGLRINELVALKEEDIDLKRCRIRVDRQADRYLPWPATTLPKHGRQRTTKLWRFVQSDMEELLEQAEDGWLCPPSDGQAWWADAFGHGVARSIAAINWRWPGLHWARHHYASVNLHPEDVGGYGRDLASVALWLGHAKPSTTSDTYLAPPTDCFDAADDATSLPPGH
jgi:integrase